MVKEYVFRFAVENDAGEHSQVWRLWTRQNDCYIGSHGTTQSYKASFHETGQCQVGLSSEIRKALVEKPEWHGKSRFYDQWSVEVDLEMGSSIKLLELIIPYSQLDKFKIINRPAELIWINCPKNTVVSIAIFKANISFDQIMRSHAEEIKELCRLPLINGCSIVVAYRLLKEKDEYIEFIFNAINDTFPLRKNEKTYIDGKVNPNLSDIRAMIWYKNQDKRYWIEASVRKNLKK